MRVCREVSRVTAKGKPVLCGRSIPVVPRGDVERRFAPKKTGGPALCPAHRARALRAAVREMFALRGCPRPEPEQEDEPQGDEEPDLEAAAE